MKTPRDQALIDELFDLLVDAPLWVGPALAAVTFAVFAWLAPTAITAGLSPTELGVSLAETLAPLARQFAPVFAGVVLLTWVLARIKRRIERSKIDTVDDLASINKLSWREFERLMCGIYRCQGFQVRHVGRAGPDGGVDIRLRRGGEVNLVQCKHWKQSEVGVKFVRELLGVVASEKAQRGILVTSGSFTNDAREFASNNPITLIDGPALSKMIADSKSAHHVKALVGMEAKQQPATAMHTEPVQTPSCPRCGCEMVRRTAQKGSRAGTPFLGCTKFPKCQGSRSIAA